jgi:hypothetical protein
MGWVGLKLWRRQWRTDSAGMVEWDEYWGLVDVNANANANANVAYLCLVEERPDVLQECELSE